MGAWSITTSTETAMQRVAAKEEREGEQISGPPFLAARLPRGALLRFQVGELPANTETRTSVRITGLWRHSIGLRRNFPASSDMRPAATSRLFSGSMMYHSSFAGTLNRRYSAFRHQLRIRFCGVLSFRFGIHLPFASAVAIACATPNPVGEQHAPCLPR